MTEISHHPDQVEPLPISPQVTLTEAAANKVWELIQEEGNLKLKLRVFITGGGCSGFQYGFAFEENLNEEDTVITTSLNDVNAQTVRNVQLLIDPLSLVYLMGAEVDYKSDLKGERFIIRNPNAKTTCGCGASFTA